MTIAHEPVMLQEVLELARVIRDGASSPGAEGARSISAQRAPHAFHVVDATVGAGGHALGLVRLFPDARFEFSDRDERMLHFARESFKQQGLDPDSTNMKWHSTRASLLPLEPQTVDFALLDLGISMLHLKQLDGGFSYEDQSLDMRLDRDGSPASELVNQLPEKELADLIYRYGEERASRRIARRIVSERPIQSAHQLADIIARALPGPRNRPHPARKTFQALRIAVNNELEEAGEAASNLAQSLRPGGILCVITFHSLEDRLIKRLFADLCGVSGAGYSRYDAPPLQKKRGPILFEKALRKSLSPSESEISRNPASRSARLRAIRRKEEQ